MGLTVFLVTGCANHNAADGVELGHSDLQFEGNILSGMLATPVGAEHFGNKAIYPSYTLPYSIL
jgi:hypothetical protein